MHYFRSGAEKGTPMSRLVCFPIIVIMLAALSANGQKARAQEQKSCSPANIPCQCSYQCCGEERCDGSVCNQCVIDCVQRQQPGDKKAAALKARCQSLMTRGFKRL